MSASLRALLAGVIDYAGLFPPAGLPIEAALRNYAAYRETPESWMLGRFICPATRLVELTPWIVELFATGSPLRLSTLGRGSRDRHEFLTGLREDLEAINHFERVHDGRVQVDVFETRLPPLAGMRPNILEGLSKEVLVPASVLIEKLRHNFVTPFYEAAFDENWRESIADVLAAFLLLSTAAATLGQILCLPAGFKLRCGGVEASAFPSSEQVAFVVTECRSRQLALKATAGLHHPLRHFDASVQARMHGFINLFAGVVLAHVHGLGEEQVQQILEDEDAADFGFDDQALRWRDLRATTSQIAVIRETYLISFGSCSFDEPCSDLRALGWLK